MFILAGGLRVYSKEGKVVGMALRHGGRSVRLLVYIRVEQEAGMLMFYRFSLAFHFIQSGTLTVGPGHPHSRCIFALQLNSGMPQRCVSWVSLNPVPLATPRFV